MNSPTGREGISRRDILKHGAAVSGGLVIGGTALSGSVSAADEATHIVFEGEHVMLGPGESTRFETMLTDVESGEQVPLTMTADGDELHIAEIDVSNGIPVIVDVELISDECPEGFKTILVGELVNSNVARLHVQLVCRSDLPEPDI